VLYYAMDRVKLKDIELYTSGCGENYVLEYNKGSVFALLNPDSFESNSFNAFSVEDGKLFTKGFCAYTRKGAREMVEADIKDRENSLGIK